MSLFFKSRAAAPQPWTEAIRRSGVSRTTVSPDVAMRHSAVWACLRLRADLISTLPLDLYRKVGSVQAEVPKPAVLYKPGALLLGGPPVSMDEWLYASQVDLDRVGNAFGRVIEFDKAMRPTRIDLISADHVQVRKKGDTYAYFYHGKEVPIAEVWHERQFVLPGLPVGLSPIAHAAMSIGQYMTAQDFALSWFSGTQTPKGIMRNTKRALPPDEATIIKERYKATVSSSDILVTGNDWEFNFAGASQVQSEFIGAQEFSITDLCRFMGAPSDMIDATGGSASITYANMTQRNLQLLVVNLGPAIKRRERALSALSPGDLFTKLNTDALLRMDPLTTATVMASQIRSRLLTPDEARGILNREPLTPAQIAQFGEVFGSPNKQPQQGVNQ